MIHRSHLGPISPRQRQSNGLSSLQLHVAVNEKGITMHTYYRDSGLHSRQRLWRKSKQGFHPCRDPFLRNLGTSLRSVLISSPLPSEACTSDRWTQNPPTRPFFEQPSAAAAQYDLQPRYREGNLANDHARNMGIHSSIDSIFRPKLCWHCVDHALFQNRIWTL